MHSKDMPNFEKQKALNNNVFRLKINKNGSGTRVPEK